MCTVTLVPTSMNKGFVLTSNRDEASNRTTQEPDFHFYKNKKALFPKDEIAGGSWIGISECNRAVNLLNGGFIPHKKEKSYKMSRGILVKEFLVADDLQAFIQEADFGGIEPFTAIIVEFETELRFFELVWDSQNKYFKNIELKPHIWSSSPLYSAEVKAERESWFSEFQKNNDVTPDLLWKFHHTAGKDDLINGLIVDREFLKTKSITQIKVQPESIQMQYHDLEVNKIVKKTLKENWESIKIK